MNVDFDVVDTVGEVVVKVVFEVVDVVVAVDGHVILLLQLRTITEIKNKTNTINTPFFILPSHKIFNHFP